jgi:hypothetical protein
VHVPVCACVRVHVRVRMCVRRARALDTVLKETHSGLRVCKRLCPAGLRRRQERVLGCAETPRSVCFRVRKQVLGFAGRPAAARPAARNALGSHELHAREMRMCRARWPSCAMSTDALPRGFAPRTSCGRRGGAHSRRSTFAGRPARNSWDATRLHAREMRTSSWYGRALRPPARGRWPLATVTAGSHGWPGEPPVCGRGEPDAGVVKSQNRQDVVVFFLWPTFLLGSSF